MSEPTNAILPIMFTGVYVSQNEFNSIINENKSLKETVRILQGNADKLRELQHQNDIYVNKIGGLEEKNIKSTHEIEELREENIKLKQEVQKLLAHVGALESKSNSQYLTMQDSIHKLEDKTLFYEQKELHFRFAIAFQDINSKYQLEKSHKSSFNTQYLKRQITKLRHKRNSQSHYLSETGTNIDSGALHYYKMQVLGHALSKLTGASRLNFDTTYGSCMDAMIKYVYKFLENPKPSESITEEESDEFEGWFDID